ncbi:MAG TPA: hypothetical protein VF395_21710, partial [Polyangiaceae bacterium]
APEQLDMRGFVDARTDVFGLGILLWEAFGNRRLFPGADGKSARERVQRGAIPRLDATRTSSSPGLSTPIADLVARALERDPAKRFQTAQEMRAAIGALDPASAERIGAWVTALAEAAITKRRQLLTRSSIAAPAPARPSFLPTRPSQQSTRPGLAPGARPPVRTGTPIGRTSSLPPAAARPPTPPSPGSETAAPVPEAKPDPIDGAQRTPESPVAAAAPSRTPEPPVTSETPSRTPEPPVTSETRVAPAAAAAAAELTAVQPVPEPMVEALEAPGERPAREQIAVATTSEDSASAEPLAADAEEPDAVTTNGITEPPAAAALDAGSSPATPDSSVPSTQPSADGSPGAATSGKATDEGAEGDAIDVTDDDLAASSPPSRRPSPPSATQSLHPSPHSRLPPRLPQDTTRSLETAGGDTSLLGAPAEPLAGPMPAPSQLTVLTSPAVPRRRRLFLAIGAALVLGVGVGGWFMGRLQGPKHRSKSGKGREAGDSHSLEPSLGAHVESVTAVPGPTASTANSTATPVAEPSAAAPLAEPRAAAPEARAPAAPAASAAPSRATLPPTNAETSKPATQSPEQRAVSATVRTTSASSTPLSPHRPPPSRGPANSGYKPGGI